MNPAPCFEIDLDIDPNFYYRLTTQWQGEGKSLDVVHDGEDSTQLKLADSGNFSGQYWRFKHKFSSLYQISC